LKKAIRILIVPTIKLPKTIKYFLGNNGTTNMPAN
jgi:hypothetical protein